MIFTSFGGGLTSIKERLSARCLEPPGYAVRPAAQGAPGRQSALQGWTSLRTVGYNTSVFSGGLASSCCSALSRPFLGRFQVAFSHFNSFSFCLMNNRLKIFIAGLAMSLSGLACAQTVAGDAKAGASKNAMCIGCHGIPGYKASYPEVYSVPMLGGQSEKYIESALNEYKKGERKHPTMRGIAGSLTDQDIADLATYYSQQK
jgi:cytochrome c553